MFYFESTINDLEIDSMYCDLLIDRVDLDFPDTYTESENTNNGVRNVINNIINFINKCADTVSNFIRGKQLKNLKNKYDKAVEKNPELKNREINFMDNSNIIDEYKNVEKQMNKIDVPKRSFLSKIKEKLEILKPTKKVVTGAALFGILTATHIGLVDISKKSNQFHKTERDGYAALYKLKSMQTDKNIQLSDEDKKEIKDKVKDVYDSRDTLAHATFFKKFSKTYLDQFKNAVAALNNTLNEISSKSTSENNKTVTEATSSIKNSKFKLKNVIVNIDTDKADINIDLKPHLDIIESNWNKIITEAAEWCIKYAKEWNMPNDKSVYKSKLKLTEICYLGGNKNHFFTAFTGPSNLDDGKFFDGHQLYIDLYIDTDKKTIDISDSISI